jgi:hypothetical protein
MLKTFVLTLFALGLAFADEIEDAIIKDLDFYMSLEVIENEDLAKDWNHFADEKDVGAKSEKTQ